MQPIKSILSIDGGGIRGIIPALVLVELERILQQKTNDANARAVQHFDLFAATSSGAILASILLFPDESGSKPKFSAQDAVQLYIEHGAAIFHTSPLSKLLAKVGLLSEKFSPNNMEQIFASYFGETKISQLLKPCLITSYNIELRKAHFFRQHVARQKGNSKDFYVRDACRATCAAPSYFPPAEIYSLSKTRYPLIDGGIVANDPILAAIIESARISGVDNPSKKIVLSLGTGINSTAYHYDVMRNRSAIRTVPYLLDMMMSSSSEISQFIAKEIFKTNKLSNHYLRITPTNLSSIDENIDNASSKNIDKIKALGERLATENSEAIERLVETLLENENKDTA
ncbi:MAG TPA: patatin-like phospholipase family protein [Chitinophagales bacterium]|nr:patatin-like phospholipase family protein [Chitinophagales bacterium]